MRGFADGALLGVFFFCAIALLVEVADMLLVPEQTISGDILTANAERSFLNHMHFSITIDLDDGRVVICPIYSETYGSTLYRLYQKRTPEMPLLRERVRVVVGRHSRLTVCRGLAVRGQQQAENESDARMTMKQIADFLLQTTDNKAGVD